MSLESLTYTFLERLSPSSVGKKVLITGRVIKVTRQDILLKAKISCTRTPDSCDFLESWIEGRVLSPASPPRKCPKCKQRTISLEYGSIDRPVYYKVVLCLNDQSTVTVYVSEDKFNQLKTIFPYELEERWISVKGELDLLEEYTIVVEDGTSSIEMPKEELEKLQKIENSACELYSKVNFDDAYTRKIFELCEALVLCGWRANRQRLGTILGVSEKTIDRIFTRHNPLRLKTGDMWNPFFEMRSSFLAAFHSKPITTLTFFGQCLARTHEKVKINEKRERERKRLSK